MIKEDSLRGRLAHLFDTDPRTDSDIADALGVTKQAVSGWRHGLRAPRQNMVETIAKMYGVTPNWLYYGDRYTMAAATGTPPTDLSTEELLLISVYRSASPDRRDRAIRVLTGQDGGDSA